MQQIVCKKNIMIETNKQMCAHNENQNQFLFLYNFSKVAKDNRIILVILELYP